MLGCQLYSQKNSEVDRISCCREIAILVILGHMIDDTRVHKLAWDAEFSTDLTEILYGVEQLLVLIVLEV